MADLDHLQWERSVVTAQGRTVPASETPWMRSREVMVHAVDLRTGISFADLPDDFLAALRTDIETKRGEVPEVVGDQAEVVAYLAGRPSRGVTTQRGAQRHRLVRGSERQRRSRTSPTAAPPALSGSRLSGPHANLRSSDTESSSRGVCRPRCRAVPSIGGSQHRVGRQDRPLQHSQSPAGSWRAVVRSC